MADEAIVSFYFGMDLPTKTTNMIAYLFDYGEKMLNKRQDKRFSLDI